jgi:uncharacterized protein
MNPKASYFLVLGLFFTSCSFNKLFLQPTKVPIGSTKLSLSSGEDSMVIFFDTLSYQPTFLKNGKDSIDYNYTLESVVFTSSNGNQLNGWILKPKNVIPKITLIHFHGNAGFLLSQYRAMTPLLEYGFQAFIFDYSGFGFSEGKAKRKNVLIDANASLDYILQREDVKNTEKVIYGQSLGGHLAVVVAAKRQSEIDALVIEGAFSSHKDIAAQSATVFGRLFVAEMYSAYKSIPYYKKPVLIIHSTEDETIPFEMGEKLFERANQPKQFYEIKGCHICGTKYYSKEIAKKIKMMLANEH